MPETPARTKARYFALMLLNAAVDMLLPTAVLVALTPTGLPAAARLAIGGSLLSGKTIGGGFQTGRFRWRLALIAALVPTVVLLSCYSAGFGTVPSMVSGAIAAAAIVVVDLVRTKIRGARPGLDAFGVLVLLEVLLGVALTSISGDARFVLARTSLYIGIGGAYVLTNTWSAQPIMRTALQPVMSKGDPQRATAYERAWRGSRRFRAVFRGLTASLGTALLADAVLRIVIIYSQPPSSVVQSSLTSQLPLIILIAAWFVLGRTFVVPRAERILEAELARTVAREPLSSGSGRVAVSSRTPRWSARRRPRRTSSGRPPSS